MYEYSGRWIPCGHTDGPDGTEAEITGLEPGKKYEFRVKAHNDEGDSDPLDADKAIIAKDPFGKSLTYSRELFWYFSFLKHCLL